VIRGFTSHISNVAFSQNAKGLFLAVGSQDASVRYFQVRTHTATQKTEVQLLWNSHQNTLYLSGARFDGALLSSRNAALVLQREGVGNPKVVNVPVDIMPSAAATSTAITSVGSGGNTNTQLLAAGAAASTAAAAATPNSIRDLKQEIDQEKSKSENALLFQHKTDNTPPKSVAAIMIIKTISSNSTSPASTVSPTSPITPKEKLDQALKQCLTAIDKKPPSPAIALRRAAALGREELVKTILESAQGIDIDQQSEETGQTVLHVAVLKHKKNVVNVLLEAGASKDIADLEGKSPADYATESGDTEIQALFKPKMAANL
jgi:hypothetical protein